MKGLKRLEVRASEIWGYSVYCVLVGRCSMSLISPPFPMILDLFKSNIMLFKGPKETRGLKICVLEIFCLFCFARLTL